jgi:hypothetical protein
VEGALMAKAADKEMTEQQERFVDAFLRTGNGTAAASYAGYLHPERNANRLMAKPHIKKVITEAMAARALQLAPQMIDVLAKIAQDEEDVQPKDRIAAAVAILDRAGLQNGKGGGQKFELNDNRTTVVSADAVAALIQATFNKGGGGRTSVPNEEGGMKLIDLKPLPPEKD